MRPPGGPLFLEQRSYRRRRLVDAARVAPFLGIVLFLAPLLQPSPDQAALSARIAYIFGAWSFLILLVLVLVRLRKRGDSGAAPGMSSATVPDPDERDTAATPGPHETAR
jgi:hypothetical protein